jgi:hypothetical protein
MAWCEENAVQHVFGLSKNATLDALVSTKADEVRTRRVGPASSMWCATTPIPTTLPDPGPGRVVARFEANLEGLDTRYVVINITHCGSQWLYDSLYCVRGQAESQIKRHKGQLASDRTTCRSPPDAADPPYRRLLADARNPERHPRAATAGKPGIPHHQATIAEGRGADQGNREPGQTGVGLQPSGRGVVPRVGRQVGPSSNVSEGVCAPAELPSINSSRLANTVWNAAQLAEEKVTPD